jgi:hypothetical protein
MAPTEINLQYLTCTYQSWGRVEHSLESGKTLVQFFHDNIMITLATALVEQLYTNWQIRDIQAVLKIVLKNYSITFLDEIISKGKVFILDSRRQRKVYDYTHTNRPNRRFFKPLLKPFEAKF